MAQKEEWIYENIVRKNEMLVTIIFSFTYNVFYSFKGNLHNLYISFVKAFNLEQSEFLSFMTSPTVVSIKGRLPEIMQSKPTLYCDIIQIHSLFRHGFIKKPKSKFNRNRK